MDRGVTDVLPLKQMDNHSIAIEKKSIFKKTFGNKYKYFYKNMSASTKYKANKINGENLPSVFFCYEMNCKNCE